MNEVNDLEHNDVSGLYKRTILAVKNPVVKCRKGRPQTARRILGNIKNQQSSVVPKFRNITCTVLAIYNENRFLTINFADFIYLN